MNEIETLTVDQVAKILQVSSYQIRKLARENRLPAYRVGNRWRFLKQDVVEWLMRQRVGRRVVVV